MNNQQPGRSRGRPTKFNSGATERLGINLPKEQIAWLRLQGPDQISPTIQRLIAQEMKMNMQQITRHDDDNRQTEWIVNLLFENPETLASYLQRAAPAGTYLVEGTSIWATDEAIDAALAELATDADQASEDDMLERQYSEMLEEAERAS